MSLNLIRFNSFWPSSSSYGQWHQRCILLNSTLIENQSNLCKITAVRQIGWLQGGSGTAQTRQHGHFWHGTGPQGSQRSKMLPQTRGPGPGGPKKAYITKYWIHLVEYDCNIKQILMLTKTILLTQDKSISINSNWIQSIVI